jgi:hypothetical protein
MKVWFWDFTTPTRQLSLFQIPEPPKEKASRIIQALDRIRERYGKESIQVGKANAISHQLSAVSQDQEKQEVG